VLKNRKTDVVLFAVLFTLYLKEDIDECGNVKVGVEGGMPFNLRAERHERERNGVTNGGLRDGEGKENEKLPNTSEDDVD